MSLSGRRRCNKPPPQACKGLQTYQVYKPRVREPEMCPGSSGDKEENALLSGYHLSFHLSLQVWQRKGTQQK